MAGFRCFLPWLSRAAAASLPLPGAEMGVVIGILPPGPLNTITDGGVRGTCHLVGA